eukprot:scaffold80897_cov24-Prasinocladus_malaysianus.AAC.1
MRDLHAFCGFPAALGFGALQFRPSSPTTSGAFGLPLPRCFGLCPGDAGLEHCGVDSASPPTSDVFICTGDSNKKA